MTNLDTNNAKTSIMGERLSELKGALNISTQVIDIFKQSKLIDTGVLEAIKSLPKPQKVVIDRVIDSGWTIPHSLFMDLSSDEELLTLTNNEIDQRIVGLYLKDNQTIYNESKQFILEEISPKFKNIINTCFKLYEEGNLEVAIPTLLTIIEGELSLIAELENAIGFKNSIKNHFGYGRKTKEEIKEVEDISVYSLVYYLENILFNSINFSDQTIKYLNRNKVLHGWDDPEKWNEVDFIRLIHTIVTILLLR